MAKTAESVLYYNPGSRGYDTFGPWKLVGGIAKGHPNARDLDKARAFYREIQNG